MTKVEKLLCRLQEIGDSLAHTGQALALLGLGSVGLERQRLDDYSDLDFFAIVENGQKMRFIEHLDWLSCLGEISYAVRNTYDGYKLLYADGIFCEFAVFEAHEMAHIPFAKGQIVWQRQDFNPACCEPKQANPSAPSTDVNWLLGEFLSNLFVGLGRYHRGEKLSALTFVEQYAFERLLDLTALLPAFQAQANPMQPADVFVRERRFEQRIPSMAAYLPLMLQGYAHVPASAQAMLDFVDEHFSVNAAMKVEILRLCQHNPPR